jgi:hypothetical protein
MDFGPSSLCGYLRCALVSARRYSIPQSNKTAADSAKMINEVIESAGPTGPA